MTYERKCTAVDYVISYPLRWGRGAGKNNSPLNGIFISVTSKLVGFFFRRVKLIGEVELCSLSAQLGERMRWNNRGCFGSSTHFLLVICEINCVLYLVMRILRKYFVIAIKNISIYLFQYVTVMIIL